MTNPDSASLPVIVKELTENAKLGPCSATYASQHSCPAGCPLRGHGCYAELGNVGVHTRRLNSVPTTDPLSIARIEAAMIDTLSGVRDLRIHVVGDSPTVTGTRMISASARRYKRRGTRILSAADVGRRPAVWTYTHAWRKVPVDAWNGVSVLASVETVRDAVKAHSLGYSAYLVIPEHTTDKSYQLAGTDLTAIPCPNQTRGIECVDCRLCLDAPKLHARRKVIAAAAHGGGSSGYGARRVRHTLQMLNG